MSKLKQATIKPISIRPSGRAKLHGPQRPNKTWENAVLHTKASIEGTKQVGDRVGEYGVFREHDRRWGPRKIAVYRALERFHFRCSGIRSVENSFGIRIP
jgi:hypothetical protein